MIASELRRLLWMLALCAVAFIGIKVEKALSAPTPSTEPALTATQTVKEAQGEKPRCLQATTTQRFSATKTGKMVCLGGFTIWAACEHRAIKP